MERCVSDRGSLQISGIVQLLCTVVWYAEYVNGFIHLNRAEQG